MSACFFCPASKAYCDQNRKEFLDEVAAHPAHGRPRLPNHPALLTRTHIRRV
ncbi:hypothetical protein [Streptomyces sp. NPDC048641]|uniref:hypothetical protein n=1 Tax=unclassified Streptomyces TaxID=2593676 RepID=UPI00341CF49B